MNKCDVCEKLYKKKLIIPQCCQSNSESKYKLCNRCIRKCSRCPFCRSEKKEDIKKHSLIFEIEFMVRVHAIYRIACEKICTDIGNIFYRHPFGDPESTHTYYNLFRSQCLSIVTAHNHQITDIVGNSSLTANNPVLE